MILPTKHTVTAQHSALEKTTFNLYMDPLHIGTESLALIDGEQ